ncbi:hypothetical protein MIU24_23430 [Streptomyces venezuelae]|uniref:hypothetical protein n=1 Tax=Streptomyces sp. B6(2022) TaxID=3404749 RepID=UPI00311E8C13
MNCSSSRAGAPRDWDASGTPTHSGSQTVWPAAPESEARQLLDAWVEGGERGWEGLELFA